MAGGSPDQPWIQGVVRVAGPRIHVFVWVSPIHTTQHMTNTNSRHARVCRSPQEKYLVIGRGSLDPEY